MKKMCVVGSLNVDVVMTMDRFPKLGESVLGDTFDVFTGGGKGANQAYALGRLGADVLMVGKIGSSFYGPEYVKVLEDGGVNCGGVGVEQGYPGIGLVLVNKDGNNLIVYYPGANGRVDCEYVDKVWGNFSARDIFLLQLEIPVDTTFHVMKRLRGVDKTIIFDPAPAQPISDEMLAMADYVTPNETELEALVGMTVADEEDFLVAGRQLLARGARCVIAKAGKRGAYIINDGGMEHVPGFVVKAVDPTAAGDSFNAGFAYGLASGLSIYESARFANAVAGLSTTAVGAQNAMPTLEEVKKFMAQASL